MTSEELDNEAFFLNDMQGCLEPICGIATYPNMPSFPLLIQNENLVTKNSCVICGTAQNLGFTVISKDGKKASYCDGCWSRK